MNKPSCFLVECGHRMKTDRNHCALAHFKLNFKQENQLINSLATFTVEFLLSVCTNGSENMYSQAGIAMLKKIY